MSVSVSSAALVGFAGPRVAPAGASALLSSLVSSVLRSGRGVASGCALGVDHLAVSSALSLGGASSLSVFSAFGPSGLGSLPGASASLSAAVSAGASVSWWAGGAPRAGVLPPVVARLSGRSLAFVSALAASGPGRGLVAVVSGPPKKRLPRVAAGRWPSCGSGTWGSVGAAAALGVPVVVFPLGWAGFTPSALPSLPVPGVWSPAAPSGVWSGGFKFSPVVQGALFS